MKPWKSCVLLSALIAATGGTPALLPAADPAKSKDAEAQIETLARYAMRGKAHELLDRLAGTWDTVTRYWARPGDEPVEAKGTSTRKWILDGRFLMEELDGGNLALPFRGVGLFGYDAFEKKYNSAWVDSMNTSITANLGTYDKAADAVSFSGQYKDPWTGTKKQERGVTRFVNKDKHALELYLTEPDGKEFKTLEIIYTRKTPPGR